MASRLLWLLFLALPVKAQIIGPLLKTEWHQHEPYNNMCPMTEDGRTIVGCVATALTEIMYTYKYPAVTLDTLHGWSMGQYVLEDILPGTSIDWSHILVDYRGQYSTAQADAVARLSLMAGMACRMNYGVYASGANTYNYLETLQPVFGYQYVHMYDRAYHSPSTWRDILVHELKQGHALLYTGYNQEFSGHAFVIDGYDSQTGLFHTGWGYGGAYNGWFDIDVLNPFERIDDPTPWGRREGLFCNHTAMAIAPTPCQPFKADSLRLDVTLDSISLPPLCVGSSCEAVFHFRNNTKDTLTYTYEVLSNAIQDTALFEQADYIGLSCVMLPPMATASDHVLLRIKQAGTRQLRVSPDDVQLSQPVTVDIASTGKVCTVGEVELLAVGPDSVVVTAPVDGSGLVTWCLFPDASMTTDTDVRHWSLGQDTITFRHLQPGHTYTLVVRYPWEIRTRVSFTTDATPVCVPAEEGKIPDYYDLAGRRHAVRPKSRVYIKDGRKVAQ